jgi:formylmethanofuran dehydrogenase subunit E
MKQIKLCELCQARLNNHNYKRLDDMIVCEDCFDSEIIIGIE